MEWPDLIVEELLRCGVEKFFIAPGSRSTPLVSAIARNEKASVLIHYDERGTAFAALGYARSTGRPAAWITTSGTAVANGLPAVVEASVDGVPMILLTADRPADLRDTGANQTILQSDIFGGYVRWKFEFPVPETQFDPAFVLTTIDQAVYRSIAENGPVHLNCMFRKPLELSEDPDAVPLPSHLLDWGNSDAPYTTYALSARIVSEVMVEKLRTLFGSAQRPVILLGRVLDSTYEKNIVDWAREEGIPVLPDISSSFRVREQNLHSPRRSSPGSSESEMNHSFSPVIPYWELLMSVEEARNDLQPDLIVQFGRGIVSTRFETAEADRVVIDSAPDRFDPGHQVILRIQADARGVNDLIGRLGGAISAPGTWLSVWQAGNEIVAESLSTWFEKESEILTEASVAHVLPASMGAGNIVVLGNSLPVRNADRFAAPADTNSRTILNRGASGIDGTIAVGAGVAAGASNRVIVMLGDQALLHDLNSLALADQAGMIVIVVNNYGGRIFHRLPISHQEDIFERFFVHSHEYTFEYAAAQFGIRYEVPGSTLAFRQAMQNSLAADGASLIEIQVDFEENEIRRQKLHEYISKKFPAGPGESGHDSTAHSDSP